MKIPKAPTVKYVTSVLRKALAGDQDKGLELLKMLAQIDSKELKKKMRIKFTTKTS